MAFGTICFGPKEILTEKLKDTSNHNSFQEHNPVVSVMVTVWMYEKDSMKLCLMAVTSGECPLHLLEPSFLIQKKTRTLMPHSCTFQG